MQSLVGIDTVWLRRCHEAILAWHMRREILCFSGRYLAMVQIRHGDEQKESETMKENQRGKYTEKLRL